MSFLSKNGKETQKIAASLARKVVKSQKSVVVALEGELGAGKTTFVKGFAKALGVKTKIKSPTFVLMKKYAIPESTVLPCYCSKRWLYHLDCYRVRDHRDLTTLDLKSLFSAPKGRDLASGGKSLQNIVLIEWPERVSKILPRKLIRVHIDHMDKNKRKIEINSIC